MKPRRVFCLIAIVLFTGVLSAQDSTQKGTIKKADAGKRVLTITVDGQDLNLEVTAQTKVMSAANQEIADPFKDKAFTVGAAVFFKADQGVLVGIRIGAAKQAGGDIRQGNIVKLDLEANTITLKADGKDQNLLLSEQTQVLDARGDTLKEKLQGFKTGASIFFKAGQKDGKDYLVAIKLREAGAGKQPQPPLPKVDLAKLIPLNELGRKDYQGHQGGFYPDGTSERPKSHEAAGLKLAKQVQPLNSAGKPDPQGKIVLLSIGMSNTSQASQGFQKVLAADSDKNPHLVFINGAVGGQTASRIQKVDSPDGAKYWAIVDQRLQEAKLTRDQVQVIWLKEADAGPKEGFPAYAKKLEDELARIVQIFPMRFPNAKMVYLSSRTFGGYAKSLLNPEPYAYESNFSVKWLIERQIKGEADLNYDSAKGTVKAPWLSWGPDLWANGTTRRADGFYYEPSDFSANDGTHHSPAGSEKIGRLMLQFFNNDTTTKSWFVR